MSEVEPPKEQESTEQENGLKDEFNKVVSKAKIAIKRSGDELLKVSKIGKLKLDASQLQRDQQRLFSQLGEIVFNQIQAGKLSGVDSADVRSAAEELRTIENKMSALQEEIEKLQRLEG